jgi:hypothetical protein
VLAGPAGGQASTESSARVDRQQVKELHFITPFANLGSIDQHGILCHDLAVQLPKVPESIAMNSVQERRAQVTVPQGLRLHQYANLYFNARNPMLYCRLDRLPKIGVVSVSAQVLDLPDVVVTDRNAAANFVRFNDTNDGLRVLDHELVYARYWTDSSYSVFEADRRKKAICAEVLVPAKVPREYVRGVYVCSDDAKAMCESMNMRLKFKVNGYVFFRGEP